MDKRKSRKSRSTGTCRLCRQVFDRSTIAKHLSSGHQAKSVKNPISLFHLLVEDKYSPEFWLHLEIPAEFTLKKLDGFLRKIWLECCGHLSAFRIGEEMFTSYPDKEFGYKSMNFPLKKILTAGMNLDYEYDFGSTTYLKLAVLSKYVSGPIKSIRLLARNNPPQALCGNCQNKAKIICTECGEDEVSGLLCQNCADQHQHNEEMFLPIVNSPRCGVCGYVG